VELYRLWFLYCHGINSIFRLEGRVLVFPYTNSYQAENRARKEAEVGKLRVLVSEQKVPLFSYYWYTSSVLLKCVTSLFAVNITSFITHQIFSSFSSDWSKRVIWVNIPQLLKVHSFPRAALSENFLLLGKDNVRGQISQHIFAPKRGYCLYVVVCL